MKRVAVKLSAVVSLALGLLSVGTPVEAGSITLTTVANAAISPGFFDSDNLIGSLSPLTDLQVISTASGAIIQSNLTAELDVTAYAFVRALGRRLAVGVETLSDGDTAFGPAGGAITSTGGAQAALDVADGLDVFDGPTAGSLALNFAISGSLSTETSGPTSFANTATTSGTFSVNGNANVLTRNVHSQNGPGGDTGPESLQFPAIWRVLVPYTNSFANMQLHLDSSAITTDACAGGTCSETAWGALGNTFTLEFIEVLDLSGQVVRGAYVVGDSGITYNNVDQTTPVPEPGSLFLLGVGLAGAAASRYRRHRY